MIKRLQHIKWIVLLVCPFFLCLHSNLKAQGKLDDLLSLEFQTSTLPPKAPEDLSDLKGIYLDNLHDLFYLIFFESEAAYKKIKGLEKDRLSTMESYEADEAWNQFLQAEIKLQWAFLKLKYGDQWGAFWSLRSASKQVEKNKEDNPEFDLNNRTSGILNILFGITPEQYQWVFNLFGMKGSVVEGMQMLESISPKEGNFSLETDIVLGMLYSHLLEDFETSSSFIERNTLGRSSLAQYFQGIILQKAHFSSLAREKWLMNGIEIPFESYLLGESFFQAGQYEEAISSFKQFLESKTGPSYEKDALLKLSLCYKFLRNDSSAQQYLEQAKASESEASEVDKNAQKIIDQLEETNLTLLQLRFSIDGGYFDRAQELIFQLSSGQLNAKEKVELVYRRARLAHLRKNYDRAIALYKEVTLNRSETKNSYFPPNAYLQLGYLYRAQGDLIKAKSAFEAVLSFEKHPYKTSLDGKAKVALQLLD